jgi:hypothetical protein
MRWTVYKQGYKDGLHGTFTYGYKKRKRSDYIHGLLDGMMQRFYNVAPKYFEAI